MRAVDELRRKKQILQELRNVREEYRQKRADYEYSKNAMEIAAEKFKSVRRFAARHLSEVDWWQWGAEEPEVAFADLTIGEAILRALHNHMCEFAREHLRAPQQVRFEPSIDLNMLQAMLRDGGFEFRGAPLREIHAATIRLPGTVRSGNRIELESKAQERILANVQFIVAEDEAERQRFSEEQESDSGQDKLGADIAEDNF